LQNLNQTIDLIESGNATLGIGSSFRQDIDKMKAFFGDEDAIKSASSTALLNALLGQDVFGAISSLGIGARGLDTPAEREFLRSVLDRYNRNDSRSLVENDKPQKEIRRESH
jgi:hypothetical protein